MALASLAAVSCDKDPLEPAELTRSVDITTLPSGADLTDLPPGVTVQAIAGSSNGAAITFSSSAPSVASVDASTGLITTVAGGEAFIIATAGGVADSLTVTVQFPVATMTVESDTLEIRREGSANLTVTLVDTQGDTVEGRNIEFITLDEANAMVDDDGVVVGIADGTATIQVTSEGVVETIDIVVAGAPLVATVTVDAPATFGGIGQTIQAEYEAESAAGNEVPGTTAAWESSDTDVATVNATTGLVTLVGEGTADITATVDNGDGVDVVGEITIRSAPILVSGVATAVPTVASGTSKIYAIVVPTGGAASMAASTSGGSGDADLYLLIANTAPPGPNTDPNVFAYASSARLDAGATGGNSESVDRATPAAGTYPVAIYAWTGFGFTDDVSGLTITATVTP